MKAYLQPCPHGQYQYLSFNHQVYNIFLPAGLYLLANAYYPTSVFTYLCLPVNQTSVWLSALNYILEDVCFYSVNSLPSKITPVCLSTTKGLVISQVNEGWSNVEIWPLWSGQTGHYPMTTALTVILKRMLLWTNDNTLEPHPTLWSVKGHSRASSDR